VPPDQRSDIERGMLQAAAHPPFSLTVGGLGCFPNFRRPRVVWVGVDGEMDALHALHDAVEGAIAPLGYPTEKRPFNPHLTLGRVSRRASKGEAAALGRVLEGVRVGELGQIAVGGFSLMRSQLRPSGAVYTQLAYVELGAADG
jgi:2'-5' RNA ligase